MKLLLATSTFCGPCHLLKRKLEAEKLEVEVIDLEKDTARFTEYGIKSIPRLVVINDDGFELIQGTDDILKKIKDHAKDQKES